MNPLSQNFDLDCLLVHVPKADNHYLPLGDFFNITYLPMGMFALAEYLRRLGRRIEMVHLGLEWIADPKANLVKEMDGKRIRAIGLSLYWHYQSYDTIEAARALKAAHPDAFVFLGGVTAGYFAEEILEKFPFIDAVVKGHGEGPLVRLVDGLVNGKDLGRVPNLVLRGPKTVGIVNTPDDDLAPCPSLDDLVYGDLSVLRHGDLYARSFGFPLAWSREHSYDENKAMQNMGRPFFPLFTGRGCPYNCTFCGGNRKALKYVNGTNKVEWRSHEKVIDDIRMAKEFGYRTMSLCFDPVPQKDGYYVELFRKIRAAKVDCDFYFECWGLPTQTFIEEFKRTFPSPESYVALSPDAGDEGVRKLNKQPYFSDAAFFDSLDRLREYEVTADIFFTIALPGETITEARKTAELKRRIATTYSNARRVMTWSVQLEPGSSQFERPETLNMITDRTCFEDFYQAHGGERADTYSSLGFKIQNYFGDERDKGGIPEFEKHLQHLKCMEFCFLAKDPRSWNSPELGRQHCLERRQNLADRRGHDRPQLQIGDGVYYEDALAEEKRLRDSRPRHQWLTPPDVEVSR